MRTSSTYIPLENDYALLEFVYNSTTISTNEVGFYRIKNSASGSINYLCYNPENYRKVKELTGNVLDVTVQQVSESQWVHFDQDRPLAYWEQQNEAIFFENLWGDIEQELFITYNSLKVHILSGYTFDDISGFIVRIAYVDEKYNQVFVGNVAYLKEDDIKYHSKPFQIADNIYDRYIEIKFPTLWDLKDIDIQINANTKSDDYLYYYDKEFPNLSTSRINIIFYEVKNYSTDDRGQLLLDTVLPLGNDTSGIVRRELELNDVFSGISAVVQESGNGDYFEFFPTYEGEFIEDYLSERQQVYQENYIIFHDIEVYEQLFDFGEYSEVKTQNFTQIQEDNFDQPFRFRPIIVNPNTIAFTVQYTVRLYNKNNPFQIIRKTTLTYKDAQKYGRYIGKLDIPIDFQPIRIVNKILTESKNINLLNQGNPYLYNVGSSQPTSQQLTIKQQFLPIQFEKILTTGYTLFVNKVQEENVVLTNASENTTGEDRYELSEIIGSDVYYGQGDGIIYLNEFDNFIKFRIYKYIDGEVKIYDELSDSDTITFYLVFEDENGEKIKFTQETIDGTVFAIELQGGEILFKIDEQYATKILNSPNRRFWITVENKVISDVYSNSNAQNEKKNFESVLYTGWFDRIENFKKSNSLSYKTKNTLIEKRINELETVKGELTSLRKDINDLSGKLNRDEKLAKEHKELLDNYLKEMDEMLKEAFDV